MEVFWERKKCEKKKVSLKYSIMEKVGVAIKFIQMEMPLPVVQNQS